MIEMALVLPILLMILLGILDFGRALNYWNDVNQIAADGARYASVNRNPGEDNPPDTSCAGGAAAGSCVATDLAQGTRGDS